MVWKIRQLGFRLRFWWRRRSCLHIHARPARIDGRPGRHCKACNTTETLTPEMYYARFGTIYRD